MSIAFPMSGIGKSGAIILFTAEDTGICIYPDDENSVGEWYNDWDMNCFIPYTGKVILEN